MNTGTNATGTTIDLGAQWIHGEWTEFEALVAMNLTSVNTDFSNMTYFNTPSSVMPVTTKIQSDVETRSSPRCCGAPSSRRAAHYDLRLMLSAKQELRDGVLPQLHHGWNRHRVRFLSVEDPERIHLGVHPQRLGLAWLGHVFQVDCGRQHGFPRRIQPGLNGACDRPGHPPLSEPVTAIDYSGNPIVVTTGAGTYQADHVIVTIPVGVMKTGSITYTPALPASKTNAIARIGSGVLNKTFLEFSMQWWPDVTVLCTNSPVRGAFSTFINLRPITGKPILMGWTCGDAAVTREAWTDTQMKDEAMVRLRATISANAPDPLNVTVTRWGQDPYALCSYSTFSNTTLLGDRALLRAPTASNKILFAGEATLDTGFAQVPGAYTSGKREADRIIALYA